MITIAGLVKQYGPKVAVNNISFEVRQGEVLGFLGPNGAGKSTTMKIITGFMPPTCGNVTVMGFDTVKDSIKARSMIGYLPENNPLYNDLRVVTFLEFVARAKAVKRSERGQSVQNIMQACGLMDVQERLIGRLSKGYRQRLGLAQALINDPPVLVLDEPTIGLDPRQIFEIRGLIKELKASRTIILSSHILPEVSQLCDRVAIINKGEIMAMDTPANLTAGLSAHSRIAVRVGARTSDAALLIATIPGVTRAEPSADGTIAIDADKDQDVRPAIARQLVHADIPLLEMTLKDMSLEEIFMHLVTEEVPGHA